MDAKAWTENDLAPFLAEDTYATTELSVAAQIMLDLAEKLADARKAWAMPKRDPSGTGINGYREPRHVYVENVHRRGRSPSGKRE